MQRAAFASEGDGNAHEHGDAGTVNLRDAIQTDNDLAGALLEEILDVIVEMIAGITDGEAALDVNEVYAAGLTDRNLQWSMLRPGQDLFVGSSADWSNQLFPKA